MPTFLFLLFATFGSYDGTSIREPEEPKCTVLARRLNARTGDMHFCIQTRGIEHHICEQLSDEVAYLTIAWWQCIWDNYYA